MCLLVTTPTEDLNVNHIEFVSILVITGFLSFWSFPMATLKTNIVFPAGLPGHVITQVNYMNSQYKGNWLAKILKLESRDGEILLPAELDSS